MGKAPSKPIKKAKKESDSEVESDGVSTIFDEDSSDGSEGYFSSNLPDNDELTSEQLEKLKSEKIGESWIDRTGSVFQWVGPKFTKGVTTFYNGILIGKRLFNVGDTVLAASSKDKESFVGRILSLYQVPPSLSFFSSSHSLIVSIDAAK